MVRLTMNHILQRPYAVIFDMDGLILDSEAVYQAAWQQAAAELGYSMSRELYACFVGRRTVDCKAELMETYGDAFPLSDFLKRSFHLFQEQVRKDGIPAKPGLEELLDFLDACSIPKAVATSTGRTNALFCLDRLADRFEPIVTGDEVTQGKPAPDIFLLAAQRLNLAPQQCLVLEDADAGVEAAHAADMTVIVVPDLKPPSAQTIAHAAYVCSSLHDVTSLLFDL